MTPLQLVWAFATSSYVDVSTPSRHVRGSAAQVADAVTGLVFSFRQDLLDDIVAGQFAKVCLKLLF